MLRTVFTLRIIVTFLPGRPRHGWEDNIKMAYQEVGRGGNNWIYLARDGDSWRALLTAVILTFVFRKMGEFVEY